MPMYERMSYFWFNDGKIAEGVYIFKFYRLLKGRVLHF